MKYAVISDIHGNVPALRLVLADAQAQGAEGYLLAGDYCVIAPWHNEVIDLIRCLPNAHIIRGNNDIMSFFPEDDSGQYAIGRWCRSTLNAKNRSWLDSLPNTLTLIHKGHTIHMAHSSEVFVGKSLHTHFRSSALTRRFPDGPVSRAALLDAFRHALRDDADFMTRIAALDRGVYIFGHNHIQCHGDFDGRLFINPGSCGNPLDCGEFCAPYTLVNIQNGQCIVEERRIPYDAEALISQVKDTPQYISARVWSELYFSAWRTCREKSGSFIRHCERYADQIGDPRRPFAKDTWEAAYAEWTAHAREWHPELFV